MGRFSRRPAPENLHQVHEEKSAYEITPRLRGFFYTLNRNAPLKARFLSGWGESVTSPRLRRCSRPRLVCLASLGMTAPFSSPRPASSCGAPSLTSFGLGGIEPPVAPTPRVNVADTLQPVFGEAMPATHIIHL